MSADYINTTTESGKTRHLARPEDLRAAVGPGHYGDSLCRVNNLGGVIDQVRADHLASQWPSMEVVIANLPLCKRCARRAGAA